MALEPITAALEIGGKLIDRLWPDKAGADAAKLKLFELQQSGELAVITGQLEINKIEAASPNLFVSGWRPFFGWVCGAALAYQYLFRPMSIAVTVAFGFPPPTMVGLESHELWELTFNLLGLGGMRTLEKTKGVA